MDAHARVADSVLPPRLVVIVAGGDVPERAALDAAWPGWADGLVGVLAADSGLAHAHTLGLRVNAGHGLNYQNTPGIRVVPHLDTLNTGHSIICRALFVGLPQAVREMLALLNP